MHRPGIPIICAVSVFTIGLAVMCHESAHALAGWLAGGTPTVITATELLGDFDSLSPAGYVALGVSGSLVNLVFCVIGWLVLRKGPRIVALQLAAFFFFAINGMLVATAMMGESLVGWGDWMTIVQRLPATTFLRILFAVLGAGGVAFMVRRSGAALGRLVPPSLDVSRTAEALRIVLVGAAAATVLLCGASVASPTGLTRASLLALGAGLGPFVPILFGVRFVRRILPGSAALGRAAEWPWFVAAGGTTVLLWFVVGPGIALS